jgi:hypothetical protein
MNYQKIYNQLIEQAQSENRQKGCGVYFEQHHIVPKCIGGSDIKTNLVLLTAREHYIAHKLLHYLYPLDNNLFFAYYMMINIKNQYQERDYIISSREYAQLKEMFSTKMSNRIEMFSTKMSNRILSKEHKQKIGAASKLRNHSNESKEKNRQAHLGKPSPMKDKTHSEDAKEKNRQAHLGKIPSIETRQKTSATLKGRVFSKDTIAKMSAAQTKRQQNKNKV